MKPAQNEPHLRTFNPTHTAPGFLGSPWFQAAVGWVETSENVSNSLLTAAWKTVTGSAIQKVVLVRLADRVGDESGKCWGSVQGIAEECEISKRSVFQALKALADAGFIRIESGGGKHIVNTYFVTLNGAGGAPLAKPQRVNQAQLLLPNGAGGALNGAGGALNGAPHAPQPSQPSATILNQGGEAPPMFEPVRRGLYRREYLAMLADCDSEIEAVKKNEAAYLRTLSRNSQDLISILLKDKPTNWERRISEVQNNPESMVRTKLTEEWQAVVTAWNTRKTEIKNAMKGMR